MSRLRVESFTISLDGFGAGPDQDIDNPLGVGGTALHGWALQTPTFQKHLFGKDGGKAGLDEDYAARGFQNIGAWILGRNMFGPVRGPWPDESWRGWWGDNPVYHLPVFVLTHYARAPLVMEGGTTFHFVTEGIESTLAQAREASGDKDVFISGGASIINQCLAAGEVDEIELHVVPILLGSGSRLFEGVEPDLELEQLRAVEAPGVTHLKYRVVR